MATRFDAFTNAECTILAGALAVFRDSDLAAAHPNLVNGPAPSRDNLLTELTGATNYLGKTPDVPPVGKTDRPGRQ